MDVVFPDKNKSFLELIYWDSPLEDRTLKHNEELFALVFCTVDKSTDIHFAQFCCFHAGCKEGTRVMRPISECITQLGWLKDGAPNRNSGICVLVTNIVNDGTQQNFLLRHYWIMCIFTRNGRFVTVVSRPIYFIMTDN